MPLAIGAELSSVMAPAAVMAKSPVMLEDPSTKPLTSLSVTLPPLVIETVPMKSLASSSVMSLMVPAARVVVPETLRLPESVIAPAAVRARMPVIVDWARVTGPATLSDIVPVPEIATGWAKVLASGRLRPPPAASVVVPVTARGAVWVMAPAAVAERLPPNVSVATARLRPTPVALSERSAAAVVVPVNVREFPVRVTLPAVASTAVPTVRSPVVETFTPPAALVTVASWIAEPESATRIEPLAVAVSVAMFVSTSIPPSGADSTTSPPSSVADPVIDPLAEESVRLPLPVKVVAPSIAIFLPTPVTPITVPPPSVTSSRVTAALVVKFAASERLAAWSVSDWLTSVAPV